MNAQKKLIKRTEEAIRFANADSEIPVYETTARDIVKDVLRYVSEEVAFEQSMRNAVNAAIEEIGE